jgi:hypothetical protein
MGSVDRQPSDRLGPGGYRFEAAVTAADGQHGRAVGYIGVQDHSYVLQAVLSNDDDAKQFEDFATSFRLLRPVPLFPGLTIGFMAVTTILILTGLWIAFSVRAWPSQMRSMRWLVLVFALMGVAYLAAFSSAVISGVKTPDELDGALGFIAGIAFGATCVLATFKFIYGSSTASG